MLEELRGSVHVDEALVDAHLETVPSLRSLSARSLASGDTKSLCWETNRALDGELESLGSIDELTAHLLERLDILGSQGNANTMLGGISRGLLTLVNSSHCQIC